MRNLCTRGVKSESRKTEAFSKEEEERSGALGSNNPKSLLQAVMERIFV